MSLHLLYLLGGPGSGKTTVLETLLGLPYNEQSWVGSDDPFAHLRLDAVVLLGRRRAGFGGTDTLPMNVARKAEAWIASTPAQVVAGEGDRLAYNGFFCAARDAGYRLSVIHLDTGPDVAAQRRAARAAALGTKLQNPTWVRGRESKAAKLAARWSTDWVNGNNTVPTVVAIIRRQLREAGNPLGDVAVRG